MSLTDRKPPLKGSAGIRSLSAPVIQVRKNKTSFLRHIFSVHNDDLSYLAKPPMGETNASVTGQNKSTAKMTQKQIGLWFRDRCYTVDKLERYEDEIYERLVSIEKTKWQIQKTRESSPAESSSRQRGSLPKISQLSRSLVATPTPPKESGQNTEAAAQKPETTAEGEKAANQNPAEKTADKSQPEPANHVQEKKKVVSVDESAVNDRVVPINVSAKQLPARPVTQQNHNVVTSPRPEMAPRAATSGEGMLDSARKSATPTIADTMPQIMNPKKATEVNFVQSASKTSLTNRMTQSENDLDRGNVKTAGADRRKSVDPNTTSKAREVELRILNEPFTYWKKDSVGKFVKADIPYRRREFPLPVERNDVERRKKLLAMEHKSRRDQSRKYRNLLHQLEELEKFNPLAEALLLKQMEAEAEKAEFDAQEKWKKLGMLRHWVKAVQVREQKELEGLDPNSEEALRKCKYLRIQDKKTTKNLTPKQEKEAKKSSWINNLQKRIAQATGKTETEAKGKPAVKFAGNVAVKVKGKPMLTGKAIAAN